MTTDLGSSDLGAGKIPAKPRLFANSRYVTKGAPRSGGIASVYEALELATSKSVAIKVFRASNGIDDVIKESFRREAHALSELKHENVVRILESGLDEETGEHFIVMEWLQNDFQTVLNEHADRQVSWEDYYAKLGRPILSALAFAHSKSIVHRDIKPSNIMVGRDGELRVCDFGISKFRNFINPGVTLSHFASMPYAPPEMDDGSYSYSRDVFGFSAFSVAMFFSEKLKTHADLHRALESLSVDESVKRCLRKSLSLENPAERPANAQVLLSEFDRIQPRVTAEKSGTIYIDLTKKVRDLIAAELAAFNDDDVRRYLLCDLKDAFCEFARPKPGEDPSKERALRLLGNHYGYIAVADDESTGTLKLISANEIMVSDLERDRDNAMPMNCNFSFGGLYRQESLRTLSEIRARLSEFASEQKLQRQEQGRQQMFKTWLDLLSAKTELENTRKKEFLYGKNELSSGLIVFVLRDGQDASVLEDKDIRLDTADGAFVGSVISVSGNKVKVQPSDRNRVAGTSVPDKGSFVVDTIKADSALDKQRVAVDAVRFGRSVNNELCSAIVEPTTVQLPRIDELEFHQTQMDEDKRDAVRTAVAGPALMVVEGPPGTGKTTFITELVLQTLKADPSARILLTSQTHVAVDNSLERIAKEGDSQIRAVRIGHEDDERIAASSKPFLLDRKLQQMRKEAIASGRKFIEQWAAEYGVDLASTRMAMAINTHAGLRQRLEAVEEEINSIQVIDESEREALEPEARDGLEDRLGGLVIEKTGLERALKESVVEFRKYEQDKSMVQELAQSSAEELRIWADNYSSQTPEGRQLKKLIIAHADWEARFGRSREFRAALIASSNIVAGTCLGVMSVPGRNEISYDLCIVDEASIATPTEVLVPMSRATRTVLVGDNKQLSPFQDPELKTSGLLKKHNLSEANQQYTLFRHLTDHLPPELHKVLKSQHRMVPEIGDLVSECFYGGQLSSFSRPPLAALAAALPKPVIWKSTSRAPNRASKKSGTSHYNELEIKTIEQFLNRLDFDLQHGKVKGEQISLAVLTGYGEQKRRLQTVINTNQHRWKSYSRIFVNVVDAFQGREADVTLFSVTRSEAQGMGFLKEMERINVALSRAKERLVIVGDHSYCLQAEGSINPLKDVIGYMQNNPQSCLIEEVRP
jgi:serine/threonine protein kinase